MKDVFISLLKEFIQSLCRTLELAITLIIMIIGAVLRFLCDPLITAIIIIGATVYFKYN